MSEKVLITGGAGFIGSYLTEELVNCGKEVIVYDNFSSGKEEFLGDLVKDGEVSLVRGDLLDKSELGRSMKDVSEVWHLAANPDVRMGSSDTSVHLEQNIVATHNLLEAMRKNGASFIGFTSTSTVYGEAEVIPTPEEYGPLKPISLYGASKLAAEALISSYCYSFDMEAVHYRFANVIGGRSTHGVIFDFLAKLKRDPNNLEILGDGRQCKSYFHIEDCIDGMLFGSENRKGRVEIFNIGSDDMITVTELANIVVEGLGYGDVNFSYTGGVDGGRGWKGDVKVMQLSIDKLKGLGWSPRYNSSDAVRKTVEEVMG